MKEVVKEIEELLWELKFWLRKGEDARGIVTKILYEISDIIEKYKKGGFKNGRGKNSKDT